MFVVEPPWAEEYRPGPGWRLFSADFETKKTVWMLIEGDNAKVRTVMPIDDVLEANAARRLATEGTKWGDGLSHVASVPMHVWQRQLADPILQEDKKALSKWLNDPDHQKFRAREGKV